MKPDLIRFKDVQADTFGVLPSYTRERILSRAMKDVIGKSKWKNPMM